MRSASDAARVVAVIPAAGRSSRFGSSKLLALIDGQPLLDHTIASLLDAGVSTVCVVTTAHADLKEVRGLRDARVITTVNSDPDRGMFSSIQTGLSAIDADVN